MEKRNEFSDSLMDFFTFRDKSGSTPFKLFGYDRRVIGYEFMDALARIEPCSGRNGQGSASSQRSLVENSVDGLVRIVFDDYDSVRKALLHTARALYSAPAEMPVRIQEVKKYVTCTTQPFLVSAAVGREEKKFYIKAPAVKRVIGKAFYNLLADEKFIAYSFNEKGIAVDAVPGEEVNEMQRGCLMEKKHFVEELVRLNVFTNLVFLDDVLFHWSNPNCTYSQEHGIYLFDFDRCFTAGEYTVPISSSRIRDKIDVRAVETDERWNIHRNLRRNHSRINALIEIVDAELRGQKEDDLAWKSGAESLGKAVRKRFDQIGEW